MVYLINVYLLLQPGTIHTLELFRHQKFNQYIFIIVLQKINKNRDSGMYVGWHVLSGEGHLSAYKSSAIYCSVHMCNIVVNKL